MSNVRPAVAADLERIKDIAVSAEMFTVDEVDFLDEMFLGAQNGELPDHEWVVVESVGDGADKAGEVIAAANFAPDDRTVRGRPELLCRARLRRRSPNSRVLRSWRSQGRVLETPPL